MLYWACPGGWWFFCGFFCPSGLCERSGGLFLRCEDVQPCGFFRAEIAGVSVGPAPVVQHLNAAPSLPVKGCLPVQIIGVPAVGNNILRPHCALLSALVTIASSGRGFILFQCLLRSIGLLSCGYNLQFYRVGPCYALDTLPGFWQSHFAGRLTVHQSLLYYMSLSFSFPPGLWPVLWPCVGPDVRAPLYGS